MKIANRKVHPAATIYPLVEGIEFEALAQDIEANGLQEPVVVHPDGSILDGRNRAKAATKAKVPLRFETWSGAVHGEVTLCSCSDCAVAYVISMNHRRRNLDASQKACVAAEATELLEWAKAAAKERMKAGGRSGGRRGKDSAQIDVEGLGNISQAFDRARDGVARHFGVSDRYLADALKLKEYAPKTFAQVKRGALTLPDAMKALKLPEPKRNEVVAEVTKAADEVFAEPDKDSRPIAVRRVAKKVIREKQQEVAREEHRAAAEAYEETADDPEIRHADCMDVIESLDDGSVHLLLTDPPYNVTDNEWDRWDTADEYWQFMESWLKTLRPKMAPEFTAFIFCDARATVRLAMALDATGWPVLRQCIWSKPNLGKKRTSKLSFQSAYEPFWHCGTRSLELPQIWTKNEVGDVKEFVAPQSNHKDPSRHPTQKPLDLFRHLTAVGSAPGELVFDPFCGAGTTALACKQESRQCITCDTSEEYTKIAKGRLATETLDAA